MNKENESAIESKKQILKSTSIVGTSQVFTVLLQVVRTKIIAALLGPTGIGLLGLYNSIVDIVRNVTGLGINFSGVRDISQAIATNDTQYISKKVAVLNKCAVVTGLIGVALMVFLCKPISIFSFGDDTYSYGIAFLSIAVFFTSLWQLQIALLQGTRNLAYMAKASVFGVLFSIIIVTPIYWFYGMQGMIPSIIMMAISSYLLSNYFVRKVNIVPSKVSIKEAYVSSKEMIKLGIANSLSTTITTLCVYYVRSFISNNGTMEEVGFFNASWSIANIYLLMVLNAMAADYFPRLTAMNKDNDKMNNLVNEQTEIALLIGAPIIMGMFIFSSVIINLLYSTEFIETVGLFNMFVVGSFLKIISWPICYIQAAKGALKRIMVSEISWNVIFVLLIILLWDTCGMTAIGISYIISYLYYVVILLFLVKPLTNFFWTKINIQHIFVLTGLFVMVILTNYLPGFYKYVGLLFCAVSVMYSINYLKSIINIKEILNKYVRKA